MKPVTMKNDDVVSRIQNGNWSSTDVDAAVQEILRLRTALLAITKEFIAAPSDCEEAAMDSWRRMYDIAIRTIQ